MASETMQDLRNLQLELEQIVYDRLKEIEYQFKVGIKGIQIHTNQEVGKPHPTVSAVELHIKV